MSDGARVNDGLGGPMERCLVCSAAIQPFISFGRMPLANGFLRQEEYLKEFFFELKAAFCRECSMTQLTDHVPREMMFHDRYPFHTATSARMSWHFRELAQRIIRRVRPTPDSFVLELGSNDGTLLQHLARADVRHLGVEPSANVARVAEAKGVRTLCRFFEEETARQIVRTEGQADVVVAANCFCHIRDLHSLAAGIQLVLKPTGVVIFEDPYVADIMEKVSYDQIYDEHAYYFSVTSVANWLAKHEFEIVDVEPQSVHGGSMRYTVARRGAWGVGEAVEAQRRKETEMGLQRPGTYSEFRRRVERSRDELVGVLRRLRHEGKRVVGYGATSKSTTVLNYGRITSELVEFISDTTPMKEGMVSPGMHIPIRSHEEFVRRYPEYALLLAWNHAEEIAGKESGFRQAGGKWISYVPTVRVESTLH